ncbi:MAG: cyclic nucleotide-binding domain-containing protein, partial [Anaerolineales bacterium]
AGAFELIVSALNDVYAPPVVRRTAAAALVQYGREPQAAIAPLVGALGDESRSVREAAAAALGQVGAPALDATLAALADPAREGGALLALRQLPVQHAAEAVRHYARAQAARAVYYHDLVTGLDRALDGAGDVNRLLADSLRDRAQRHAVNALRAVSLLGDTEAMGVAIENLRSRDPNQRANALETLETIGDAEIIPPVLEVWEASVSAPRREPAEDDHLLRVMQDPDAWLRACAALAGANSPDSRVRASLEHLAQFDPDLFVRATAASASKGAIAVDTIPTLSPMERILFLRRVPLFADLSPADLKQVAAVASEQFFPDGEVLFRQGEPGAEMFIVVSGEVRVVVSDEGKSEEEVARRKAGEYVGEMAIISQEPRMASLVASGDVRTLCIDQKHFEGILRERPETSLAVMRVLCARLREK